jgi:hypothetical protein
VAFAWAFGRLSLSMVSCSRCGYRCQLLYRPLLLNFGSAVVVDPSSVAIVAILWLVAVEAFVASSRDTPAMVSRVGYCCRSSWWVPTVIVGSFCYRLSSPLLLLLLRADRHCRCCGAVVASDFLVSCFLVGNFAALVILSLQSTPAILVGVFI